MKRDQVVFLVLGAVMGLLLGVLLAVVVLRPDIVGFASAPSAQAAGQAPAGGGMGGPAGAPADGGMGAVAAQLNALRARLDQNPNDVEALLSLGELYLQANMADQAAQPIERALTLAGSNPQMLIRAANVLMSAGQARMAYDAARRAMDADKRLAQAAELAANIALRGLGDADAATVAIDELKRRAPNSPSVATLTQELERVRGLIGAAGSSNDYSALVQSGNYLFDVGRWAESEAAYRKALKLQDADPNVITDLGITLFRQNRPEEALQQFDKALAKNPGHWQAALNGTVVAFSTNDIARGKAWLARLKALNPTHPAIPQFEARAGGGGQ